jgi:hypothetical protein
MILAALDQKSSALDILDDLFKSGIEFPEQEDATRLRTSLSR